MTTGILSIFTGIILNAMHSLFLDLRKSRTID